MGEQGNGKVEKNAKATRNVKKNDREEQRVKSKEER